MNREVNPSILTSPGHVKVRLTVHNLSVSRLTGIEIEDTVPPKVIVASGSNKTVIELAGHAKFVLEYYVTPPSRGLYSIGPANIRFSDPLGMFPSEMTTETLDTITVYPETRSVRMRINPRRTGAWSGSTASRRAGAGMEFYGLRDYHPGDELRSVNWKATGRLSRIVTNEYEAERASDTVVLIDAGRLSGFLIDERSILDYEAEAALSLASFLLNAGNRVGLILHGEFRQWLYPGFGKKQYLKLRDQLMLAREGDSEIPLSFLVSQLAPMILARGCQVVVIAHPFTLNLPEALINLNSLGYQVATILVLPYREQEATETSTSLAGRMLMVEKEEIVSEAQQLCPTVIWQVNESLSHVLRRFDLWVTRPKPFAT